MLCSNRFPLPGSPSTCQLDTAIVPVPSLILFVALLILHLLRRKGQKLTVFILYSKWIYIVYILLVVSAIGLTIVELARQGLDHLGMGLLPANTVGLILVLVVLVIEIHGRTRVMMGVLAAYWLLLTIFETIKVMRLHLLTILDPTTMENSKYPSSDQFLDNAVLLGLYIVFFFYEIVNVLQSRVDEKSKLRSTEESS